MGNDFLSVAAKEALRGIRKEDGGPFGAVIIRKNKIIAKGHNTVLKSHDATCHAEINALRAAFKYLREPFLTGCVVYTTTEPCPMCFSALHWARVKEVVYSTTIEDVFRLGFNELHIPAPFMKKKGKSPIKLKKVKNLDCINLLASWKRLPRKKTY